MIFNLKKVLVSYQGRNVVSNCKFLGGWRWERIVENDCPSKNIVQKYEYNNFWARGIKGEWRPRRKQNKASAAEAQPRLLSEAFIYPWCRGRRNYCLNVSVSASCHRRSTVTPPSVEFQVKIRLQDEPRVRSLSFMSCSLQEMNPPAERARHGEVSSSAVDEALNSRVPKATKEANEFWVRVFESFCVEKQLRVDLKTCVLQSSSMTVYACSMLQWEQYQGIVTSGTATWRLELLSVAMHARHLSGRRAIFWRTPSSNVRTRVLDGVLKQRKERGEEPRSELKAAILEEDMERLKEYFRNVTTECDPVKLTQYCWFYLTLHFCSSWCRITDEVKEDWYSLSVRRRRQRLSHVSQEREPTISQFLQNVAVRPKLWHTTVQPHLDWVRFRPSETSFNMAAAAETKWRWDLHYGQFVTLASDFSRRTAVVDWVAANSKLQGG